MTVHVTYRAGVRVGASRETINIHGDTRAIPVIAFQLNTIAGDTVTSGIIIGGSPSDIVASGAFFISNINGAVNGRGQSVNSNDEIL